MKISLFIYLTIPLLISSCSSTTPDSFYDSNGKKTKSVTCSIYNKSSCIKQAGKICKSKGYKIIRKTWPSPYISGLDIQCNQKQLNKSNKSKPIDPRKVVIIKGSKDAVINGNVLRGAKLYGSGDLIINGYLKGGAMLSGSGDLIINGSLMNGAKLHGSGDLIVKGDAHGNILSTGSGDVTIKNDFYGIMTIRGSGDLAVGGTRKGTIKK